MNLIQIRDRGIPYSGETSQRRFELYKEREPFSLGGLTNSFNDTPPLEKYKVQITPRVEQPALKDVPTMGGMSLDMEEQDNESIMSNKDRMI